MRLVTADVMRELDRATIQDLGLPGRVLMETAGRACADRAAEMLGDRGRNVLVLCGPGNNGGDGLVVARLLADRGFAVTVALLARADALAGDAAANLATMRPFPVELLECPAGVPDAEWARAWDLVVDAIFGTGLARDVTGPFADAVTRANALACPRLAVDLPTGVHADTGRLLGVAFRASATVTFAAAKIGHFSHPGRAFCGAVVVAPIGIPASRIAAAPGALLLSADDVRAAFPRRDPAAFKNRYGHLLVVGGLTGKTGAAFLAATAALRSGAGLVTVATDRAGAAAVQGRFPDVMVEGAFDLAGDWVQSDDASVDALVAGRDALVAGPGLSTRPGADALLDRLLRAPVPVVLDADALNLVAARGGSLPGLGPDRVLTPHPGEAGRLLGIPGATVQADRVSAVRALVDRTGCVVVLKGAGTLVATPDGRLAVNDTGGPALAVAGSGDVLAGMVGALLARGLPPFEAAGAAVHLHGLAGDLAARDRTEHGVLASDLVDTIPAALRSLGVP